MKQINEKMGIYKLNFEYSESSEFCTCKHNKWMLKAIIPKVLHFLNFEDFP